jgi:hypothetical protein
MAGPMPRPPVLGHIRRKSPRAAKIRAVLSPEGGLFRIATPFRVWWPFGNRSAKIWLRLCRATILTMEIFAFGGWPCTFLSLSYIGHPSPQRGTSEEGEGPGVRALGRAFLSRTGVPVRHYTVRSVRSVQSVRDGLTQARRPCLLFGAGCLAGCSERACANGGPPPQPYRYKCTSH